MDFVRTLKAIYRMDEHLVGERAVDLAALAEKGYAVPLSFVVTNESFEQFIVKNKLQQKIAAALQGSDAKAAYDQIHAAIAEAQFPAELQEAISEAYESVSIDPASPVQELINGGGKPFVTVFLSPNYTLPAESAEGAVLSVRGVEQLLFAIRECWATLFLPRLRKHRHDAGIGDRNLNAGIIIQRSGLGEAAAESWPDAHELLVRTYFGAVDIGVGIGKDEWRLSEEYLKPAYQSVGVQREMLSRDEEGRIERVPIGERGTQQKVPDREVLEAGRLAKKAAILLERPVKLFFDVRGEALQLLLCNRISAGQQYSEEETIQETPGIFTEQQAPSDEESIFESLPEGRKDE